MTIERLSFPNGLLIEDPKNFNPADLIAQNIEEIKSLSPGEYNITPQVWTKHIYNYNLLVHDGGTATLRMIPRYPDSQSQFLSAKGLEPTRRGGKIISIPQDQPMNIIGGPKRGDPRFFIFEIIFHLPEQK